MADIEVDFSQFDKFVDGIVEAALPEAVKTVQANAVNKLAAEYLGKAIEETPDRGVHKIQIGEKEITTDSEHMKRSWGAESARFIGGQYRAKVYNSASYASYVNDGHRQHVGQFVPILGKRLVKPWVDGQFMAEKAEKHTRKIAASVLQNEILRHLKGVFRG